MKIVFMSLLFVACIGCAVNKGKSLLVTSETIIGLKIGTNNATQTPEVKLGYIRTEGAVVPTQKTESGELNTASVLARLNFQSLWNSQGGIYSVIATGNAAESESVCKVIEGK